jgi:hypothetical protein
MAQSIETNQRAAERNIAILQEMMYRSSEAVDRSAQNNLKMIDRIISNNAENVPSSDTRISFRPARSYAFAK